MARSSESEDHTRRGSFVLSWVTATVIVLPVLYVLSIGPMFRLCMQGHAPDAVKSDLPYIYGPLHWVAEHVPALAQFLHEYVIWWVT
jgi:hypothetical protein